MPQTALWVGWMPSISPTTILQWLLWARIASTALKNHMPVFANDSASVERGVLAAVAYDRFAMGKKDGGDCCCHFRGEKGRKIFPWFMIRPQSGRQ